MKYTPSELVPHLKKVIRFDKYKSIPTIPTVPIPQQKQIHLLSGITVDVKTIDAYALSKRNIFDDTFCSKISQQEEVGIGYRYSELQPYSMPKVGKILIGTRLNVF